MYVLKNLNSKELRIIEDKKINEYRDQESDQDIYTFSNHTANTIEDWHDECEDEVWK
jgi:hypothetical protein